MATDAGTPAASGPERPRRKGSIAWRALRLVLIGAVVSAALLVAFPPTDLIKDELARSFGTSIGRSVTIGALRLRPVAELGKPRIDVELDDVRIANPAGMPARDLLQVATAKTRLELLPLIKSRVRMERLDLVKPRLTLEEDADGARNWVFAAASATTPAAAPGPAATAPSAFRPPPVTTVADGSLAFRSAKTGAERAVSAIGSVHTLDLVSGALASKGSLAAGGETVAFDVALGDVDAVVAGSATTLKASLDARPLRASLDGEALFAAAAEFKGALSASTASLMELARWLGADVAPSGEPLRTSLAGRIVATTEDMTFSETDVMINTTASRFDGTLALGGTRPKLSGTIASEHIDLGRIAGVRPRTALAAAADAGFEPVVAPGWEQLLSDLKALEQGPQAAAPEAAPAPAPAAAAVAAGGWSDAPFNLAALKAFDLDVLLNAAAVTYGGLDLRQGRVKADLADGILDARLEELAVGAGKAVGTVNIDSRAAPPRAQVALTLTDVAAEPIVTELTGKPLLSGTSNVEITAAAAGQTQSQLASTIGGKARFRMGRGALRGFDVRRMIFEWWKSWSFDLAAKTGFERLEAQYDIKNGILKSEPGLALGGPEVEINSAGTVNLPKKKLDQEIRVRAIPPPTAFPIPVRISGDWTKPSIGIDWGGLFSAGAGLGGPQALAPAPGPPPANVEAAIRRVLAADLPPDRLTPEARRMLEALLPPESVP